MEKILHQEFQDQMCPSPRHSSDNLLVQLFIYSVTTEASDPSPIESFRVVFIFKSSVCIWNGFGVTFRNS